MTKRTMRPRDALTYRQICALQSDARHIKSYWIALDGGDVVITRQRIGEAPTQEISIPRRDFNALVDWYMKPQTVKE